MNLRFHIVDHRNTPLYFYLSSYMIWTTSALVYQGPPTARLLNYSSTMNLRFTKRSPIPNLEVLPYSSSTNLRFDVVNHSFKLNVEILQNALQGVDLLRSCHDVSHRSDPRRSPELKLRFQPDQRRGLLGWQGSCSEHRIPVSGLEKLNFKKFWLFKVKSEL